MGKIFAQNLDRHIPLPRTINPTTVANAIKQWFTKNGLIDGTRYVETKQGLRIHFTGISEWHFAKDVSDSRYKDVALQAIAYLPEVFETGQYTEIQALTKDRSQKRAQFVKFHLFRKKVRIGNTQVTIRAKAGEYASGKIVLLPKLTSYTFYLTRVKKENTAEVHSYNTKTSGARIIPKISKEPNSAVPNYDSLHLDSLQAGDLATFEILAIEETNEPTDEQYAFDCWLNSWFR